MFNKFMNWAVLKLESWCEKNGRFKVIMNGTGEPYLVRYFVFHSKPFSIYIHRFLTSDHSVPHDHPFSFLGYVVRGRYQEDTLRFPNGEPLDRWELESDCKITTAFREQGTWAWRPSHYAHVVRNINDRKYNLEEKHEAPLTIIFRGPYNKNWGFWDVVSSGSIKFREWIYYKTYLTGEKHIEGVPMDTDIEGAR